MSTQVLNRPTFQHPRPRALLTAALALAVAAGAGVAVGALASSGSSTTDAVRQQSVGTQGLATTSLCAGDAGYLLAEIGAMPAADYERVIGKLSPQTRALLGATAVEGAIASAAPSLPTPSTLARILARIGTGDARVITSGLSPETRLAVGSVADQPVSCT